MKIINTIVLFFILATISSEASIKASMLNNGGFQLGTSKSKMREVIGKPDKTVNNEYFNMFLDTYTIIESNEIMGIMLGFETKNNEDVLCFLGIIFNPEAVKFSDYKRITKDDEGLPAFENENIMIFKKYKKEKKAFEYMVVENSERSFSVYFITEKFAIEHNYEQLINSEKPGLIVPENQDK